MNPRLLVLILPLALLACSEPPPPAAEPKIVRTLQVGEAASAATRAYSGEVHARHETQLAFRVGGKIVQRLVDAGATVKAGQPLAKLDPADTALQAAQAEAQRSLAEAEVKRYRDLRAKNFISQSALDAKETLFKAADAQAGLARNQAAYTVLTADRAGTVAAVLAEVGQVVAPGQAVIRLAPDGEKEVAIAIPESEVAHVHPGDPAEIVVWAGDGKPLSGKVRERATAADPTTRTYPARVSVSGGDGVLILGMTATVRLKDARRDAGDFRIPIAAVFQKGDVPAVWVVTAEGAVTLRPVEISGYGDDGARVRAGLQPGERIVAAGVHKLVEGEHVRLAEPPSAAPAAPAPVVPAAPATPAAPAAHP